MSHGDFRKHTDPASAIKKLMLYERMHKAPHPDLIGQSIHRVYPGTNVYLMTCREIGSDVRYLKIGVARDVAKRMAGIHTDSPLEVRKAIYFCFDFSEDAYRMEKELHTLQADNHHRREWFRFDSSDSLSDAVIEISDYVNQDQGEEFRQFIFDYTVEKYDPRVIENGKFFREVWRDIEERTLRRT